MTNRKRGYDFEHFVVQDFNKDYKTKGWYANRLGGTTTELPDIVVTNSKLSILYTFECKATTRNYCYIPNMQIERCQKILDIFSLYKHRNIVLAFKFLRRVYDHPTKGPKRDVKTYYLYVYNMDIPKIRYVSCTANGKTNVVVYDQYKEDSNSYQLFSFCKYTSIDDLKKETNF